MRVDSVEVSQKLIQFKSVNPPGEEAELIAWLGQLLSDNGVTVETYEFEPNRPSIVARVEGTGDKAPLAFTGHIDVVPLGAKPWTQDPFAGNIVDGKLYGRGATDMKSGVGAFVAATINAVKKNKEFRRGITLVITAGEETGCQGAFHLDEIGVLGPTDLLIVAEPSSVRPIVAHKGSVRMEVQARGKTCHSSMPWVGDNAIDKVAEFITRLEKHEFDMPPHPVLGKTTSCVSTINGGQNINSVPDLAKFTVDFRTIPEHDHDELIKEVQELFGDEAEIKVVTNFLGFSTEPTDPAVEPLMQVLEKNLGFRPEPEGAPYFTDASALVPAFNNAPTVVIGPGDFEQCHQTDEFCPVEHILESNRIYEDLIEAMCR